MTQLGDTLIMQLRQTEKKLGKTWLDDHHKILLFKRETEDNRKIAQSAGDSEDQEQGAECIDEEELQRNTGNKDAMVMHKDCSNIWEDKSALPFPEEDIFWGLANVPNSLLPPLAVSPLLQIKHEQRVCKEQERKNKNNGGGSFMVAMVTRGERFQSGLGHYAVCSGDGLCST